MGTNDSDWGTTMPSTVKLMGITNVRVTPHTEAQRVEDLRGTNQPSYETVMNRVWAECEMAGLVAYDDLPYWLDALFGTATPAPASDEYSRTYAMSPDWAASDPQPKIFTITYGETSSDANIYGIPGATLQRLRISGRSGAPATFTANFFGKQVEADTFDALNDRDVTFAMGAHGSIAIDPGSDAAGTTPVSDTFFAFDLELNPNRAPKWIIGSLTPNNYRHGKWSGSLRLTLELNPTTAAYVTSILAATTGAVEKNVRIQFINPSNTDVVITLDFMGAVVEAPQFFTDEDGIVSLDVTLQGHVDSGQTTFAAASVVNTIATLA
jgi:hypothetical protein